MQAQVTISVDGERIVGASIEYGHNDPKYVPGRGKQPCTVAELYELLRALGPVIVEDHSATLLSNAVYKFKNFPCAIIPLDDNPEKA